MDDKRREFFYSTDADVGEGYFAIEDAYKEQLRDGDILWIVSNGLARAHFVSKIAKDGILLDSMGIEKKASSLFLSEEVFAPLEELSHVAASTLPAMRPSYDIVPFSDRRPLAIEVEHRDPSGPGEMVIELYDTNNSRRFRRTEDDELEGLMADSFETLLRLQLKTLESTAEIGHLWIQYLKYKRGKKHDEL